jgi:hypothetical protein
MNKINTNEWRIIEVLANGDGTSTSEIYKKLKMSCRVFNKHAQKLMDLGFISSKKVKVYKQKSILYFLTHEGELAYILRTGKLPKTKPSELDEKTRDFIVNYFTLKKWELVEVVDGHFVFRKSDRKIVLNVGNELNRSKIYETINKSAANGELYFVCFSENIKNLAIQQAARYNHDHRGMSFAFYVASLDDLKAGKDLRKIEFTAS